MVNREKRMTIETVKSLTRPIVPKTSIRTKGRIIDAQYEISVCTTEIIGPDPTTAKDNVDGVMVRPGFTNHQWLNCQ